MALTDLPDGYYLAEQKGQRPGIVEHVTLSGESHWRGPNDLRMRYDPRRFNFDLTPLSEITAMKDDLAAMTARAEKADALKARHGKDYAAMVAELKAVLA